MAAPVIRILCLGWWVQGKWVLVEGRHPLPAAAQAAWDAVRDREPVPLAELERRIAQNARIQQEGESNGNE